VRALRILISRRGLLVSKLWAESEAAGDEGSGRKRGDRDKYAPANREMITRTGGRTPLERLLSVLDNPATSEERHDRIAVALLPYFHARQPPSLQTPADVAREHHLNGASSLAERLRNGDAETAMALLERHGWPRPGSKDG
jgi:hypothetical protein